jgi:hypothetical protein
MTAVSKCIAIRSFVMSPLQAERARRLARRAKPPQDIILTTLKSVLRAIPRPPQGASVTSRHARLRQVVDEFYAYAPATGEEAMLAAHLIALRHAAADTARQAQDATSMDMAFRLRRCMADLLRTDRQLERELRRLQAKRTPDCKVPTEVEIDLAELDAIWCGFKPLNHEADGLGQAASASQADPAVRTKSTLCGQRIDLLRLDTIPAAGTA